jgi:hypothetical protein
LAGVDGFVAAGLTGCVFITLVLIALALAAGLIDAAFATLALAAFAGAFGLGFAATFGGDFGAGFFDEEGLAMRGSRAARA